MSYAMATPNQQFCLRWNNHQPNFIAVFSTLLRSESMCDVTLATEGKHILAHKIVLSACSSYFQMLFAINPCKHPIVILKDVQFKDLKTLIDFIYVGEVNVSQDHLPSLLKTAETLQIKGLTEMPEKQITLNSIPSCASTPQGAGGGGGGGVESPLGSPSGAYKRKRMRKSSAESVVAGGGGGEDGGEGGMHRSGELHTMVKPEHGLEVQRQPTPQMDDKSPRSASMSSAEAGPSSGGKSDLLLPVKTIILTSTQSKSLDSGIGCESAPTSVSTSLESGGRDSGPVALTCLGSKQRRFLMRQHRVKKEYEEGGDGDGEGGEGGGGGGRGMTRQCSEPAPATEHLLSVPQASYLTKQHSHPLIISTSSSSTSISPSFHVTSPTESSSRPLKVEEFRRASSTPQYTLSLPSSCISSLRDSPGSESRSSHCPELRQGPALGCNFCWNTIDGHGRILRRKTKYHCPECQTNLCIVPCFQQYHERQEAESSSGGATASSSRKPSTVTSHLQPTIVKTSSL